MTGTGARVASAHATVYWAMYRGLRSICPAWCPHHTLAVLVLSACGVANLLTALNLLWLRGLVADPYRPAGPGQRYELFWIAVVVAVEVNVMLARRAFDRSGPGGHRQYGLGGSHAASYVSGSLAAWSLTWLVAKTIVLG